MMMVATAAAIFLAQPPVVAPKVAPRVASADETPGPVQLVEPRPLTPRETRSLQLERSSLLQQRLEADELWVAARRRQIGGWATFWVGTLSGVLALGSGGTQMLLCSIPDGTQTCVERGLAVLITGSIITVVALAVGLPIGVSGSRDVAAREAELAF